MNNEKAKVLYVDDEANNLVSFKANFREYFEVYLAASAYEAKAILENHEIHIIITDQLMPSTTGVQFLESIIDEFPLPVRMILSAYANIGDVIEAINKGKIYRYILKPFEVDELKLIIDDAFKNYSFRKNDKLQLDKYEQLFEDSNDTFFSVNTSGYFTKLNAAGLKLLKLSKEELTNVCAHTVLKIHGNPNIETSHFKGQSSTLDCPIKILDIGQNYIDAILSYHPIFDINNVITGYQGMIKDLTRQKETESLLIRTVIEIQEAERSRIAKDIHDSIGQQLSAITFYLNTLAKTEKNTNQSILLSKSTSALKTILSDVRNICFNLMPNTLESFGLVETVKQICRTNQSAGKLDFNLDVSEDFPLLNKYLEISIIRIVQEFINNSIKHSCTTQIDISLQHKNNSIQVELKDYGNGFDLNTINLNTGMGLKNVRSRVKSYNGEIKINSSHGKGTEYSIFIPLNKQHS